MAGRSLFLNNHGFQQRKEEGKFCLQARIFIGAEEGTEVTLGQVVIMRKLGCAEMILVVLI